MKKLIKYIGILILACALIVVSYLASVYFTYDRIEDNIKLIPKNEGEAIDYFELVKEYCIITQNMGFGAYTSDFTFFMDGGKESRARSIESIFTVFEAGRDCIKSYNPDILLLQEIDTDSTRSKHIDEVSITDDWYEDYSSVFASNYHSAYLMYPITCPHGASNSGIVTYSRAAITSGVRRQLPISDGFSKLLDLDRCYSKARISLDNGKELIIYNIHMSAYATGGHISEDQVRMLASDMQAEYLNGNYCICGGDFNSDFTDNSVSVLNNGLVTDRGWAQPFPDECLTENIKKSVDYSNGELMPTCRDCDKPYEEGDFTIIVDGFIVSDNVNVTYLENVQTNFEYSDHNPVVMKFILN